MSSLKILLLTILLLAHDKVASQEFNVMSYNLRYDNAGDGDNRWGNRKVELSALVRRRHPAILGVQEGLHSMIQYLDSCLPAYKHIGVGREDGITKGEYAAVFYDTTIFHLLQSGNFWLSSTPDKPSKGWDAALNRICTYALMRHRSTGRKLWVFNTHFDHAGTKAREMSARLIWARINLLNKDQTPVVLMGDLNAEPGSEPLRLLMGYFDDGKEIAQQPFYGPAGTFNGFEEQIGAKKRIDYVLTLRLQVASYGHLSEKRKNGKPLSDHNPVFAKLKFAGK